MKTLSRKAKLSAPVDPGEPGTSRHVTRLWQIAAAVTLLTVALYFPALRNEFLVNWDENIYILDNPHIRSLNLDFFRWAFLDYKTNLWHPVTWISHAIDYAIWGLKPFGHHLTSILLHGVNTGVVTLLAYRLLRLVDREPNESPLNKANSALVTSAITGLLFGIHPLHVESVAWITERKDLLYALFYLLSTVFYLKHAEHRQSGICFRDILTSNNYRTSLILFLLSLSSKPMAVTLPVILLLLDWFPLKRMKTSDDILHLILEKIPFFLLSGAISIITIMSQINHPSGGMISLQQAPPLFRLLLAMKSLMLYLVNIIAPVNLLPIYLYPRDISVWKPEFALTILFIALFTALLIIFRKQRAIVTAILFFTISLLPVLGLTQTGVQAMADRFTYLAIFGPILLFGLGGAHLWSLTGTLKRHRIPIQSATIVLAFGLSLLLSVLTFRQIGIWKNAVALWTYAINMGHPPDKALYIYRADALEKSGKPERALEDYERALAIDPRYPWIYFNRGIHFMRYSNYGRAIEDFSTVVTLTPDEADAYLNRGNAYLRQGDSYLAIRDYSLAIEKNPLNATIAYVNRSNAYANIGENDKAIQDITTALDRDKELLSLYLVRGNLNMKTGNLAQAMEDYKIACEKGLEEGCRKAAFPF